jgi:transmembrane serine protease 11D
MVGRKTTATVALIVVGITGAVAQQQRFETPRVDLRTALPKLEDSIDKLDIPVLQKQRVKEALQTVSARIVGGLPTTIEENPWQVALIRGLVAEPLRWQFCGGSIIAADWVITAAHCVDNTLVNKLPHRIDVVAGTTQYKTGGERVGVRRIFVHRKWDSGTFDNDVALLQLRKPLPVTNNPRMRAIARVSADTSIADGTGLIVTGWGHLTEAGRGSDDLMGAKLPLVSRDICNLPDSYAGRVTTNMFCAGLLDGGRDACQGDSGGPVWSSLQGTEGVTETLVGVVSWGEGCARRLKYGIYTNLQKYDTWIQRTMRRAREGIEEPDEPTDEASRMASNELDVNESEWLQLSQADRDAIETILRESQLIHKDVVIAPKTDSPRMIADGDERGLLGSIFKPLGKWACKRGCEAIAAVAIGGCSQLTAGIGAPICVGLAERAEGSCKKRCK